MGYPAVSERIRGVNLSFGQALLTPAGMHTGTQFLSLCLLVFRSHEKDKEMEQYVPSFVEDLGLRMHAVLTM